MNKNNVIIFYFYLKCMSIPLILLGGLFVCFYGLNVIVRSIDILYNIHIDIIDRANEEAEKNKIPESVKHIYS